MWNMGFQLSTAIVSYFSIVFDIRHTDHTKSRIFHRTSRKTVYQFDLRKWISTDLFCINANRLFCQLHGIFIVIPISFIIRSIYRDRNTAFLIFDLIEMIGHHCGKLSHILPGDHRFAVMSLLGSRSCNFVFLWVFQGNFILRHFIYISLITISDIGIFTPLPLLVS